MTKAEELWEKYLTHEPLEAERMYVTGFHAALKEYGAEVRKRDAEVCRGSVKISCFCADTIDREPLP